MRDGFVKVAAVTPKIRVADTKYNADVIVEGIREAAAAGAKVIVLPELVITGYTCSDLFLQEYLLEQAKRALGTIAEETAEVDAILFVGLPLAYNGKLYNVAAVLCRGEVLGFVPKTYLPNYNEFYEARHFARGMADPVEVDFEGECVPMGTRLLFVCTSLPELKIGAELCEDLWVPTPPSGGLTLSGANIIANLSASDEYVSKAQYRRDLVSNQSARCICAYVYSGAGVCESTTDLVFSGATLIAENGSVIAQGKRFARDNEIVVSDIDIERLNSQRRGNMSFENSLNELKITQIPLNNNENDLTYRFVDAHPFVPSDDEKRRERCEEIFAIQAAGLAKRLEHVGSKGCVIGISGGLDSTLALLVAVEAMKLIGKPSSDILGITMPGFGTTDRTYNNAIDLMKSLGVTIKEISIKDACVQHMKDIEHDEAVKDITYENTQARERTQILFDMANKHNCLLVGTGDLSELAMGWCTYNGDHMSMYGVNASVPKTLVRYLVDYVAKISDEKTKAILLDVLDTPVSPELLPPDSDGKIAQKTEDNIGPYELHDFFLYNFVRFGFEKDKLRRLAIKAFDGVYDSATIEKWLGVFMKRFFISQFKRSCIPDSPKVGSVSLSPRGDWRMPSDASFKDFI